MNPRPRRLIVVATITTGPSPIAHYPVEISFWDLSTGARGLFLPPISLDDLNHADRALLYDVNRYTQRRLGDTDRWDYGAKGITRFHQVATDQTLVPTNTYDAEMLNSVFLRTGGLVTNPWHDIPLELPSYAAGVLGFPPGELTTLAETAQTLRTPGPTKTAEGDATATGRCLLELMRRRDLTPKEARPNVRRR